MPKDVVVFLKVSRGLSDKLFDLSEQVHRNRCEVLRALVAGASVEQLPRAWRDQEESSVLAEIEG